MKAIGLATAMTIVLLLLATLTFRLFQSEQRVRQLAVLYAICAVLLVCLWLVTPDELGVLPPSLVVVPGWLDLLLTVFFFSAAFFGGVLQLYNLADRGFSLRILIDALEHPSGTVDIDRLIGEYGGGRGIRWMYDKRVGDMFDDMERAGNVILFEVRCNVIRNSFIPNVAPQCLCGRVRVEADIGRLSQMTR